MRHRQAKLESAGRQPDGRTDRGGDPWAALKRQPAGRAIRGPRHSRGGNEEALMSVQEDVQEKQEAPKKPAVAIETERRGGGGHLGR